ncbi:hypothetical protein CHS0354_031233 [Potamilus streckersoni]|uniref:Ig-like domain-containing protein n=1 Tax=Potamilus streckersoni TaxID=2493646 RepID=A0AAE0VGM6_9BIVA|nr:hypothetical protein CHS0354_031233 [Potamilus streckersoni]
MLLNVLLCYFVQLLFITSVGGVSMSVTPSSMVVGSASSVTRLELRCSSDGTSNNGIYSLEISRKRFTETRFSSLVVLDVLDGIRQDPNMPADILAKSPNITGGLVGTSGTLTLTMDGGSITCSDQAEFKCEMTFKITGVTGSQTLNESTNFTVITVPSDFRITDALYEDKGIQLQLTNDSKLNVGTRITYRCSANIGSDSSLAIVWERSSMLGASTDFTAYTPTVSTDIVQDPPVQGSCSYTRTSTMYYNMTNMDDDGVLFRCKVRVYIGNQWYDPISVPRRTFAISSGGTGKQVAVAETPAQAGMIAGAVIGSIAGVVLIIVLIYFLWYRRRGTGESYRTKEEGERPEPPPTDYTYATADKKKRTNLGTKVGDSDSRKPPGSSELHYAELELSKEPRPIPRKSKAKDPPVEYTEIRFNN